MANPSRDKGNAYEWALVALANDPDGVLCEAGLTVERTRAGYERDEGDLLVLTPDRQRLAAVQAKNRRERKWSQWLADTERQGVVARARFAALFVKRVGIGDVGRSYAITTVAEHLRLLAALHTAERELAEARRIARTLAAEATDPDALADPPGTVRGAQVYPPRVRPFGPQRPVGSPR